MSDGVVPTPKATAEELRDGARRIEGLSAGWARAMRRHADQLDPPPKAEAKPSTSDLPAGVRDAAWQAYLAEDTVTAAIDAAVTTTHAAMVNRSSEARDRILARHARRPDGRCVMCRWADGSVAAWPCPDYLDAQALVPADGVAAGRAQAAADIRAKVDRWRDTPNVSQVALELLRTAAKIAEGGGEADHQKALQDPVWWLHRCDPTDPKRSWLSETPGEPRPTACPSCGSYGTRGWFEARAVGVA